MGTMSIVQFTILYLRALFGTLASAAVRPYLLVAAGLIVIGTGFYTAVEQWHPLDAAYFSVSTLSTVGYGDVTPRTSLGKAFTMLYIVAGLGVLGTFIGTVAQVSISRTEQEEDEIRAKRQARRTGGRGAASQRAGDEADHAPEAPPQPPESPAK